MEQLRSSLDTYKVERSYSERLEAVLSESLNPENINDYANNAICQLIELVEDSVTTYGNAPTLTFTTARDNEEAAFSYCGLPRMDFILDHVDQLANKVHEIGKLLNDTETSLKVIVPPDALVTVINGDDGIETFQKKESFERTKTVLFVLQEDFDIDIQDPDQVEIIKGSVKDNMVRKSPYYMISVSELDKVILVCDEEGNATFILDQFKLRATNLSNSEILNYSKRRLDSLIHTHKLGKKIIYSEFFVSNIKDELTDSFTVKSDSNQTQPLDKISQSYLYPKLANAPRDYLSVTKLSKQIGIDRKTMVKAVQVLSDELGEVGMYKFGKKVIARYSPLQQELIKKYLNEVNFTAPMAPEDYVSVNGLRNALGLASLTVRKAIKSLGDELGEVGIYKFYSQSQAGYSPEQQKRITQKLQETSALIPKPPEGYSSLITMSKNFGLAKRTIKTVADDLSEELGIIQSYKLSSTVGSYYSPEQQERIMQKLKETGALASKPPLGVKSIAKISKELGIVPKTLSKVLTLDDDLGELKDYRFGQVTALGLTTQQLELVVLKLEAIGAIKAEPPEGYVSRRGIAENLEVNRRKVSNAVDQLQDQLGDVKLYRFGQRTTFGYSPEQQAMIAAAIVC